MFVVHKIAHSPRIRAQYLVGSWAEQEKLVKRLEITWCPTCHAHVNPEGKLDVTGITHVCPFSDTQLIV